MIGDVELERVHVDPFLHVVETETVLDWRVVEAQVSRLGVDEPPFGMSYQDLLEDFIVVNTDEVLLICRKEKEQSIKDIIAEVKRNKGDKYL